MPFSAASEPVQRLMSNAVVKSRATPLAFSGCENPPSTNSRCEAAAAGMLDPPLVDVGSGVYFGAARNEAGGPGSFRFFPVSVTCVPSIFRMEMLLSR